MGNLIPFDPLVPVVHAIICGGRNFNNFDLFCETLGKFPGEFGKIIVGGAKGVDTLAARYAYYNKIPYEIIMAEWDVYGLGAGLIRNLKMLDLNPDLVIAFPGGNGTAHMVKIAKEKGIPVWEVLREL